MTDPQHKLKRSTIQPRGIKVCILNFVYEIYFTFPNFISSVAVNSNVQIKLLYCRVWQVLHTPTELRVIDMFRKIHFSCPDPWVKATVHFSTSPLRKHTYSNILKILPPKNENFQINNSDSFPISDQNIDCGYLLEPPRRGGSNENPQPMFLSRNKKNNVYPCKSQFYYIKVGFQGFKIV